MAMTCRVSVLGASYLKEVIEVRVWYVSITHLFVVFDFCEEYYICLWQKLQINRSTSYNVANTTIVVVYSRGDHLWFGTVHYSLFQGWLLWDIFSYHYIDTIGQRFTTYALKRFPTHDNCMARSSLL